MSKIIVTGGAGFVGSHIVDALINENHDVHVIDNFSAGKREDRINSLATYHEVDITEYESILPIFEKAEYVFHLAAKPSVQLSIKDPITSNFINIQGTSNVLHSAHQAGVKKFINSASGGSAYGNTNTPPFTEDMLPHPTSPYGLQKYFGEQLCQLWSEVYGLPTVSLRYFNIYGPRFNLRGAYTAALGKFLMQRAKGEPITIWGDGSHTRDFIHVKDIVTANLLALRSERVNTGEVINVGSGQSISIRELAELIGGPIVYEEARHESAHVQADISKMKDILGFSPTIELKEGVRELKDLIDSGGIPTDI